ncbi:tripartite tricarboxylate transporter TctB family protein [Barrientosiimonas humi]|uniref:tripartite tricarboxylate transporter TctB family protein n=1 Tax=Barrientosiimonas humi TaxID=999931 RepID=UPI00370D38E6
MSHVDDSHLDDHDASDAPTRPVPAHDWSQLGLAAGLVVVAVVILVDAAGLRQDFAQIDPIGPRVFPQIVAVGLIVLAVLLTIATFRGSVPEGAEGEDVDLSNPPDWKTLGALFCAFLFLVATVDVLGWTISSALFFTATTYVLGSRSWVRNLLIGTALGLFTFYAFYSGLGVMLPAGILDGIL